MTLFWVCQKCGSTEKGPKGCEPCRREYNRRWHRENVARSRENARRWAERNPERMRTKAREWKRRNFFRAHHLTQEQYSALLAVGCVLCGTKERLVIDHDHRCCPGTKSCGKCVRGLLCHKHNAGLGYFDDDPDFLRRAAEFIEANSCWGAMMGVGR